MFLNNPGEEAILREEAEVRRNALAHSSEVEREAAMQGIEQSGQAVEVEESDFEAFHKAQNITRAQNCFLAAHPEYINFDQNTVAFVRWFQDRGIEEPTFDLYEHAFVDLVSRKQLKLNSAPSKGGLTKLQYEKAQLENNMTAQQLFEEHQKAVEQAAAEEAEDRAIFEKSEARGAFRWLRQHPEFVQCPENIAQFQLYFNNRRIDLNRASVEQIEEAYQALKGSLKLRKIEPQAEQLSQQSLYDLPLGELERRAGGRQTDGRQTESDDYVPDSNIRYKVGGVGLKF
jgi:hypothetical protein